MNRKTTIRLLIIVPVLFATFAIVGAGCASSEPDEWGGPLNRVPSKEFLNGQVSLLRLMTETQRPMAKKLARMEFKEMSFKGKKLPEVCELLEANTGVYFLYAGHPSSKKYSGVIKGKSILDAWDRFARKNDIGYLLHDDAHRGTSGIGVTVGNCYTKDIIGVHGIASVRVNDGFLDKLGLAGDGSGTTVDCVEAFRSRGIPFPIDAIGKQGFAKYDRKTGRLRLFNFHTLNLELLELLEKEGLLSE
jgi:hypothetical protein